jgi:hypothetical protein
MYSASYHYFNIRSDEKCSQYTDSKKLLKFLTHEVGLIETTPNSINGNSEHPWLSLSMVVADENGSYSSNIPIPDKINFIPIVGSKDGTNREDYIKLLTKIAQWLNWELIDEEDEDNENFFS